MMKKRLHELIRDFEWLMDDITDIKNITAIFVQNGLESSLEPTMQSIINTQLKLLERVESDCLELDDKFDLLMHDYMHEKLE